MSSNSIHNRVSPDCNAFARHENMNHKQQSHSYPYANNSNWNPACMIPPIGSPLPDKTVFHKTQQLQVENIIIKPAKQAAPKPTIISSSSSSQVFVSKHPFENNDKNKLINVAPTVKNHQENAQVVGNIVNVTKSTKSNIRQVHQRADAQFAERKISRLWSNEDDALLRNAIQLHGEQSWTFISKTYFKGERSSSQCKSRWQKCIDPRIKKGKWSEEEDRILIECMNNGIIGWTEMAKRVPGRQGKQIKERWNNHLCPSIKKEEWSEEEIQTLLSIHRQVGNKWAIIKQHLPGRTEHGIKNKVSSIIFLC